MTPTAASPSDRLTTDAQAVNDSVGQQQADVIGRDEMIFRYTVCGTLAVGVVISSIGVLFPRRTVLRLVTPGFDMALSIPIAVGALFGFKLLKNPPADEPRYARIARRMATVYFGISVPVHLRTWVTRDVEKSLTKVPKSIHAVVLSVQTFMLASNWASARRGHEANRARISYVTFRML